MSIQNRSNSFRSIPQKRFSLWLPVTIYNRLSRDSISYGVPMSHIVKNALLSYYRSVDDKTS